jgi:hypothetical protein
MSIYAFAPKSVVDALSPKARNIIENRIINNELKPYYNAYYSIRIRGIKPDILYTQYSNIRADNTLEIFYVVDHEEEQCKWINNIIDTTKSMSPTDLLIKSMTEQSWCNWEDKYMSGQNILPEIHLHGYRDILNNTFIHCIAYACLLRTSIDLEDIERQFQHFNFMTHPDMLVTNNLGMTPLKILMHNEKFLPFVESVLLRMKPEICLKALPFLNWHNSWGNLLQQIITKNADILIVNTQTMPGFLTHYLYLIHNSEEALIHLFQSGYELQYMHIMFDKLTLTQKQMISKVICSCVSWDNLAGWINLILENI